MDAESRKRIYRAVRRIPSGRVATYGQVARLAGLPGRARHVGRALGELSDTEDVPWHRVVNAAGAISARGDKASESHQRSRLEREGIVFSPNGKIPLARFQWKIAADPASESFRRSGGM